MSEHAASTVWADAFAVERRGTDLRAGLAGGLAACAPLALGIALDEPAIGVIACFGGLNAALGVPRGRVRKRLGWGIGASLLCTLAITLASAVESSAVASALVAFLLVAAATSLRALGPDGGLTGFVTGAIFTITGGVPMSGLDVGQRTFWFLAGAAAGVALMTLALAGSGDDEDAVEAALLDADAAAPAPAPPWREQAAAGAARMRAAMLGPQAWLRGHALRLALIVALEVLVYKLLDLEHGYWIPLTTLAVLQPDERSSRVRAIQRAAGTLVGTLAIALVTIAVGGQWLIVAAQGISACALFALYARNYFWLVVLLTPTALLTVSAVDYQGASIALQRAGWSALGIALGLAVGELAWRIGRRGSG
ncbi:FUSC family protein [Conexibacter sp. JD483]|uniref:FUSC family protein n=1 Tax=unclassified Conexibacter TaxID=2627773 RepID=UPI00272359BA|nr:MULTISPECIES: FUSC family protein [unclassified Conexibacter]MDO8187401.1 FUSC family protein [Conexibacter sp. CPCC 205706]MDO8200996.1 FUSC family protein [Conexibacter sp. CPCC 205762]MDR9370325.1 FUSC family protein [Conexibacter sp. JD483]